MLPSLGGLFFWQRSAVLLDAATLSTVYVGYSSCSLMSAKIGAVCHCVFRSWCVCRVHRASEPFALVWCVYACVIGRVVVV